MLTHFLGEAALDDGESGGLSLDDRAGRGGGLPSGAWTMHCSLFFWVILSHLNLKGHYFKTASYQYTSLHVNQINM